MEKLTEEEEHRAAALLLGMFYYKKTHTYVKWDSSGSVTVVSRLDADTLEPVTLEQSMERFDEAEKKRDQILEAAREARNTFPRRT